MTRRQNYIVTLLNPTNESQVFATSQAFEIQRGTGMSTPLLLLRDKLSKVTNITSTMSATASSTTSSQNGIPNAQITT